MDEKALTFRELRVWNKSHLLVLDIYKTTRTFPKDELYGIVSQIRRSTSSICANIAEGYKKTRKEFVRFLDITQGSLEETKYHLLLSRDLDYLDNDKYNKLIERAEEIGRMLNALTVKLRS